MSFSSHDIPASTTGAGSLSENPHPIVQQEHVIAGGDIVINVASAPNSLAMVVRPPRPPAEKLPEQWNFPQKNIQFTGRVSLLATIDSYMTQKSDQPVTLTACHGLGGIGKTQIASAFVWEHYQHYRGVCWFNAETRDRLCSDYINLGLYLHLFTEGGKDISVPNQISIVKTWLENPTRNGWLLVYDNASKQDDIYDLLPVKGGKILITSRHTLWPGYHTIPVDVFTLEEAQEYVRKIIGSNKFQLDAVSQLVEILGRLPLALAQACAYISRTHDCTVTQYLDEYRQVAAEILSEQLLLSKEYDKAVAVTWNVTLKEMLKESSESVELLYYCSYLYHENIPNELIKQCFEALNNILLDRKANKAKRVAKEYSMITINEMKHTFSLHPLVQQVIRDQHSAKSASLGVHLNQLCEALLKTCNAPATDEVDLQDKLQVTFQPHIESIHYYRDKLQLPVTLSFIRLRSILGVIALKQGFDTKALTIQEQAVRELSKHFPHETNLREILIVRQARVLIDLHRYLDAKQVLETPITDSYLHSWSWKEAYADLLCRMHNLNEAESYILKLLSQLDDSNAGLKHRLLYQLSHLYAEIGKFKEAKARIEIITSNPEGKNRWILAKSYLLLTQLDMSLEDRSNNPFYLGNKAIALAESVYGKTNLQVAELYAKYSAILNNSLYRRKHAQVAKTVRVVLERFSRDSVVKADLLLGQLYARGVFNEYDSNCAMQRAFEHIERAANAGEVSAQISLANLFSSNIKFIQHNSPEMRRLKRFELLEQASKTDFRAQFELADMINKGDGPAQNWTLEERIERIFPLIHSAAMSGLDEAECWLGQCYLTNKLPSNMKLDEAERLKNAKDWLSRGASQGHRNAKSILALLSRLHNWKEDLHMDHRDIRFMYPTHFAASVGYIESFRGYQYDRMHDFEVDTGYSPLHYAAKAGELKACQELIRLGSPVDIRNMAQETPLLMACAHGHFEVAQFLLANRADANASGFESLRPLFFATIQGRYNIVKSLVEVGANTRHVDVNGYTFLHYAVIGGDPNIIDLLLQKGGININAKTKEDSNTALHLAAKKGLLDIYNQLVNSGADISITNELGENCLDFAAASGNLELLRIVLKHVTDINAETKLGLTALCYAASEGDFSAFQMLIEAGARIIISNDNGYDYLLAAASGGCSEILQKVLATGIDINTKSEIGLTAIHCAAASGQLRTYRLLKEEGADITARDDSGRTCLHFAAAGGHPDLILNILSLGIDVNIKDVNGSTALCQAAKVGHLLAFQILLSKGADVDAVDEQGWNCLHYAMANREKGVHEAIIAFILKNRLVNQHALTKNGESVEDMAQNQRMGAQHWFDILATFGLNDKEVPNAEQPKTQQTRATDDIIELLALQKRLIHKKLFRVRAKVGLKMRGFPEPEEIKAAKQICLNGLSEQMKVDEQTPVDQPQVIAEPEYYYPPKTSVMSVHEPKLTDEQVLLPTKSAYESLQQTITIRIPGLIYHRLPGNGHCLYKAVEMYLNRSQELLREDVAAYIEHHFNEFREFLELSLGQSPENYIQGIRNGKEWAANSEIMVLMKRFRRPIVVVGPDSCIQNWDQFQEFRDSPIFVYYNGHNHYDALVFDGTKQSQEILLYLIGVSNLPQAPSRTAPNLAFFSSLANQDEFTEQQIKEIEEYTASQRAAKK